MYYRLSTTASRSIHDRILNCCFLRLVIAPVLSSTYYWSYSCISTWQNIELLLSSVSRTCNTIIYVLPTRSELWYQYITTPVHWTLNLHALHTLVINMFVTVVYDTTASRRSIVYMTEYTTYITSASRSTHRIQYVTYSKLCSTGSLER